MKALDRFAEAIMKFEGWHPGSRSYRNCNPGNLRWSKYQDTVEIDDHYGQYAVFYSFAKGWKALLFDIVAKSKGAPYTSSGLDGNSTMVEFFKKFAPSRDGNKPYTYARYVSTRTGIPETATLNEIVSDATQRQR